MHKHGQVWSVPEAESELLLGVSVRVERQHGCALPPGHLEKGGFEDDEEYWGWRC